MLPEAFINTPIFGIALTVIVYAICEQIIKRFGIKYVPPILMAAFFIVSFLLSAGISYEKFNAGGSFVGLFLGPATIALALPLHRNWQYVKENALAICGGILFGTLVSIVAIFLVAKVMGASEMVLLSMLPKSVTTPIAIEIAKTIGGIPPLTTAVVIMSGCFGAAFNHKLCNLVGMKNDLAMGLAIGLSSHGIGTSACAGVSMVQLTISGIAMGLTGAATSILAPILLPLLQNICK